MCPAKRRKGRMSKRILLDEIEYEPPFWYLGVAATQIAILQKVEKVFEYRHRLQNNGVRKTNGANT